jgi:flavodoxin
MKVLLLYDSVFGNTEQIVLAIDKTFRSLGNITTARITECKPEQLARVDLLMVGSPTQKFRPLGSVDKFFKKIPGKGLIGIKVAAFDTRIAVKDIDNKILKFFVKIFGYAAEPIAEKLKKKGGELIIPPEGFLVKDIKGPLKQGELERAENWAKQIMEKV